MIEEQLKQLPADMYPAIHELPGDLARLAAIVEQIAPGKGVEATMLIAQEFRGTTIYCHNIDSLGRKARDRRVRERFDAGERVPDIARTVNLSERRVWEILGQAPVDERQGRLF